jgi:hypothetical protein
MRITITIDASDAEAAALVEKLKEVFGDSVQVDAGDSPVSPSTPVPVTPVEPDTTVDETPAPADRPPGRGQILKNPQLTGDTTIYGEWQVGPKAWWLSHHLGVSRPGGETQAVRCELKRPDTSFEGYDRYLSEQYGNTALEMGGAWRTFNWEFHQSDVSVRGGFTYDLAAVFHPLVKNKMDDGSEQFMGIEIAGDWMANLEWRWVVKSLTGDVLAADEWRDGETLGTLSFDLPFEQPHQYRWQWVAPKSEGVTFSLEFRNKWGLAMTKVWLHEATCVER